MSEVPDRTDAALRGRVLDAIGYDELRAIASRIARGGRVPPQEATSLLHEAITNWMSRGGNAVPHSREAAIAAMVVVIRNAAIDRARRASRDSVPRPVDPRSIDGRAASDVGNPTPGDPELVDRALEELRVRSPRVCAAIELRCYAGLELSDVAEALNVSLAQVKRDIAVGRAFIRRTARGGHAS